MALTTDIVYDLNSAANRRTDALNRGCRRTRSVWTRSLEPLSRLDPSGEPPGHRAFAVSVKPTVEIFDMAISNFNTGIQLRERGNQVIIRWTAFRNNSWRCSSRSAYTSGSICLVVANSFLGYDMPDGQKHALGPVAFDVSATAESRTTSCQSLLELESRESGAPDRPQPPRDSGNERTWP